MHQVGQSENKHVAKVFLFEALLDSWVSYTQPREIEL